MKLFQSKNLCKINTEKEKPFIRIAGEATSRPKSREGFVGDSYERVYAFPSIMLNFLARLTA